MKKTISQAFEEVILDDRFKESQLLMSKLDKSILDTEEFKWYSLISIGIMNGENFSDEEKLHFLAMHKTFLQFI